MKNVFDSLSNEWHNKLLPILGEDYFKDIDNFIAKEQGSYTIYPPVEQIFTAFNLTSPKDVKVVIIGQDPYHGENQAHGLAFSVASGVIPPPSLRNIFKAISLDLGVDMSPNNGDLTSWAQQGVLLINNVLTVRDGEAASHRGKAWERFTTAVIKLLSNERENIVYILWGKDAWQSEKLINGDKNLILKSVHPSPLSAYRGFFEANHFSATNKFLLENGKKIIDFKI